MPHGQGVGDRPYGKGYGKRLSGRHDRERPYGKFAGERPGRRGPVPSAPLVPPPPSFDFDHHQFPALKRKWKSMNIRLVLCIDINAS